MVKQRKHIRTSIKGKKFLAGKKKVNYFKLVRSNYGDEIERWVNKYFVVSILQNNFEDTIENMDADFGEYLVHTYLKVNEKGDDFPLLTYDEEENFEMANKTAKEYMKEYSKLSESEVKKMMEQNR